MTGTITRLVQDKGYRSNVRGRIQGNRPCRFGSLSRVRLTALLAPLRPVRTHTFRPVSREGLWHLDAAAEATITGAVAMIPLSDPVPVRPVERLFIQLVSRDVVAGVGKPPSRTGADGTYPTR